MILWFCHTIVNNNKMNVILLLTFYKLINTIHMKIQWFLIFDLFFIDDHDDHDEFTTITLGKKKNKDDDKGNIRASFFTINNDLWKVDIIYVISENIKWCIISRVRKF